MLSHKKLFLLLGGVLILFLIYVESFVKAEKDFDIFIGAAKLLIEGKSCYNVWIHSSGKDAMQYFYSPLFAIILVPLSYLHQNLYNVIWISINIFFLCRIIFLLDYFLCISSLSAKRQLYFYLIITACALRFLLYNFDLGQMTIFLVYASLESVHLINENKKWQGAALLALAINIKLLPLTLLVYLFYRGEFKASLLAIIFSLFYLFLPALFIEMSFNNVLLYDWWGVIANKTNKSIIEDVGREGLSAFVPAYVMDVKEEISLKRNLFHLSTEGTMYVLSAFKMMFVLLSIYFLRLVPFKKETNHLLHFYSLSYIMMITPLIAPGQGKYSFFYLLPSFSYLTYVLLWNSSKRDASAIIYSKSKTTIAITGIIISFIFSTLTTDGIIGRHLSDITAYYHLITIGAILLIIPMALLTPERIIK